jgi:hypothetical protein
VTFLSITEQIHKTTICIWDHPFRTSANFHYFWPLPLLLAIPFAFQRNTPFSKNKGSCHLSNFLSGYFTNTMWILLKNIHTLISLINLKSRLPILKNSTLHKKKSPLHIYSFHYRTFWYSYRTWWRFFSLSFWAIKLYSSSTIDGKCPVDLATFAPLQVYSNLHGYYRDDSSGYSLRSQVSNSLWVSQFYRKIWPKVSFLKLMILNNKRIRTREIWYLYNIYIPSLHIPWYKYEKTC